MDRCALFVDAGYMLADGAMAVYGTRNRESVSWDYTGVIQFLGNMARDRTGLPLLRCYWYEATVEGRRTPEHDALADLPGVKLRLGRMRPGRREGVESEIHRDLATLARNRAVSDALVVSAEEDLTQVIADVQDLGMRVTVVHIAVGGNWTISRTLRQECDGILEIGEAHLRPYVELVGGADSIRADERHAVGAYPGRGAGNGHGPIGMLGHQPALPAGGHPSPPAIYTAPVIAEYQRMAQPLNGRPAAHQATADSGPIRGPMPAQQEQPQQNLAPAQSPAHHGQGQQSGQVAQNPSQPQHGHASQQPGTAPQPAVAGEFNGHGGGAVQGDHPGAQLSQPIMGAQQTPGSMQAPPQPSQPVQTGHPGQPHPGQPHPGQPHPGQPHPGQAGQFAPHLPPAYPAAMSPPNAGLTPGQGTSQDLNGRSQPGPHAQPGGSPQMRSQQQSPAGPPQGMPQPSGHGQPSGGVGGPPPTPPQAGIGGAQPGPPPQQQGQAMPGMQNAPQTAYPPPGMPGGAPGTGPQAVLHQQSAMPGVQQAGQQLGQAMPGQPGVQSGQGMQPSQPIYSAPPPPPGPYRNSVPEPVAGQVPVGARQMGAGAPSGQMMGGGPPGPPMGQPMPAAQHAQAPPRPYQDGPPGRYVTGPQGQSPGGGAHQGGSPGGTYVPPQGPYSGPQPATPHAPVPPPVAISLADAVQAAHGEGFHFGQAVARDAPALWLEAVLARKPRMPSDLEARLLQDSSLPIDSLLHDEVRHALRRGFWDALERSRH